MNEDKCYKQVVSTKATTYIFDIIGSIDEAEDYIDLIRTLRCSTEDEKIIITLNTPGGSIAVGVQIINAMRNSLSTVTTVMDGEVYSLGSLIFLAGDNHIINKNCLMMCHNYSGGTYGKGHEQAAELEAVSDWFEQLATEYYKGFLTDTEIKRLLNGKDYWLDSDLVIKRLKRKDRYT